MTRACDRFHAASTCRPTCASWARSPCGDAHCSLRRGRPRREEVHVHGWRCLTFSIQSLRQSEMPIHHRARVDDVRARVYARISSLPRANRVRYNASETRAGHLGLLRMRIFLVVAVGLWQRRGPSFVLFRKARSSSGSRTRSRGGRRRGSRRPSVTHWRQGGRPPRALLSSGRNVIINGGHLLLVPLFPPLSIPYFAALRRSSKLAASGLFQRLVRK